MILSAMFASLYWLLVQAERSSIPAVASAAPPRLLSACRSSRVRT
jgi:hypothetical protein